MLAKLKRQIKELASYAVKKAEEELGSDRGQEKKRMAVNFVVSNLPVTSVFRPLMAMLLSGLIDDAVEFAVHCMNLLCEDNK